MPTDSSGNYTLYTPGNPVVTQTTIASAWANNTLNDIATAISNRLDRTGNGVMLAQFKGADGTVTAPGHSFGSELGSGLFRAGAGDVRMAILGALVGKWTAAGYAVTGTLISSGALTISSGGAAITGNSTITGTLGVSSTLTVTAGGLTVTAGGLTVSAGGANITGGLTVDGNSFTTGTIPTQSGHTGELLQTNGTIASWGPSLSGNAGKVLAVNSGATAVAWSGVNQAVSSSSGAYTQTSTTAAQITNCSVSLTTSGRPVLLQLLSDSTTTSEIFVDTTTTSFTVEGQIQFTRDAGSTFFGYCAFTLTTGTQDAKLAGYGPGAATAMITGLAAGTYTFAAYAKVLSGTNARIRVNNCVLVATELR